MQGIGHTLQSAMKLLRGENTMREMKEYLGLLQVTARSRFRIGRTNGFPK